MCKRLIINAGIKTIIIRNGKDKYTTIQVFKWIEEDERKNTEKNKPRRTRFANFPERDNDYSQFEKMERQYLLKSLNNPGKDDKPPEGGTDENH